MRPPFLCPVDGWRNGKRLFPIPDQTPCRSRVGEKVQIDDFPATTGALEYGTPYYSLPTRPNKRPVFGWLLLHLRNRWQVLAGFSTSGSNAAKIWGIWVCCRAENSATYSISATVGNLMLEEIREGEKGPKVLEKHGWAPEQDRGGNPLLNPYFFIEDNAQKSNLNWFPFGTYLKLSGSLATW